jgi:hypothetical protein
MADEDFAPSFTPLYGSFLHSFFGVSFQFCWRALVSFFLLSFPPVQQLFFGREPILNAGSLNSSRLVPKKSLVTGAPGRLTRG